MDNELHPYIKILLIEDNPDISKFRQEQEILEEYSILLESDIEIRTQELNEAIQQQKLFLDEILKSSQFKTEFLATMSHELRTPLNAIIAFNDLFLEGILGPLTNVQLEYIQDIKNSGEHQYEMINHILDISKIESGQINLEKKFFQLITIIDQVITNFKVTVEKKGLKLIIENYDEDLVIYADSLRFKEILINLISNAIKYTINGSINIKINQDNDNIIFKVKDTGIGIAKKDYDEIFKEFKRVDSPYVREIQGTGLGLSLTQRLVNLHGGDIFFNSKLDIGTTFVFTIPKKKK